MYRKISYLLFLLAVIILFFMDSNNINTDEAILLAQSEIHPYSEEELSSFDGKNSYPSYIAIDDIIYDISNMEEWEDIISDEIIAGKDISDLIKDDPIKDLIIEEAPVVGILHE